MESKQFGTLLATEEGTIDLVCVGLVAYDPYND